MKFVTFCVIFLDDLTYFEKTANNFSKKINITGVDNVCLDG